MGFLSFEPYVASLAISAIVSLITGFLMMKYVVFVDSNLRGRIQFVRYTFSTAGMLLLNYVLLNSCKNISLGGFLKPMYHNSDRNNCKLFKPENILRLKQSLKTFSRSIFSVPPTAMRKTGELCAQNFTIKSYKLH